MKKYFVVLMSILSLLFLSACSLSETDLEENPEAILLKEEISQSSSSGENISWIPEGYTGAIAVITEANSGNVIVQTGDQLLYRNEIYGFQVLLGKDWKGVEITTAYGITYFVMPVPGREESDKNSVIAPGMSHFSKTIMTLHSYSYQEYSDLENSVRRGEQLGLTIDEFLKNTIIKNNHYVFVDFAWDRQWYMKHNESNFEREKYLDLFYKSFQVFDREETP